MLKLKRTKKQRLIGVDLTMLSNVQTKQLSRLKGRTLVVAGEGAEDPVVLGVVESASGHSLGDDIARGVKKAKR